ncbi:hypothetical protein PCE1_001517 [Barthelona sp. PCE]
MATYFRNQRPFIVRYFKGLIGVLLNDLTLVFSSTVDRGLYYSRAPFYDSSVLILTLDHTCYAIYMHSKLLIALTRKTIYLFSLKESCASQIQLYTQLRCPMPPIYFLSASSIFYMGESLSHYQNSSDAELWFKITEVDGAVSISTFSKQRFLFSKIIVIKERSLRLYRQYTFTDFDILLSREKNLYIWRGETLKHVTILDFPFDELFITNSFDFVAFREREGRFDFYELKKTRTVIRSNLLFSFPCVSSVTYPNFFLRADVSHSQTVFLIGIT